MIARGRREGHTGTRARRGLEGIERREREARGPLWREGRTEARRPEEARGPDRGTRARQARMPDKGMYVRRRDRESGERIEGHSRREMINSRQMIVPDLISVQTCLLT